MNVRLVDGEEVRSVWHQQLEKLKIELQSVMCNLSPTLFAVKIAKNSLQMGTASVFQAANAAINGLWDSIAAFQEVVAMNLGAGEEMRESELLLGTIAEALGELDVLEGFHTEGGNSLENAIAILETSNAFVVPC